MVSRGYNLGVAILASHMQNPTHTAKGGECLCRRKKDTVIVKKESMAFHVWVLTGTEGIVFLLLLDSAIVPRVFVSFLSGLCSYLIKVSVYNFLSPSLPLPHYYQDFLRKHIADQELDFLISSVFGPSSARKDLSSCKCSMNIGISHWRECADWNLLRFLF